MPGDDVNTRQPGDLSFDDMVQYTADHSISPREGIQQNEYFSVLQQLSGHNPWLEWVPSYGNYNGTNADVDAWIKWEAYNRTYKGEPELTRDAAGQQRIRDWLSEYSSQHPNDDPLHLKPIDSQDWNGFEHDLGMVGGVVTHLAADVKFAISSFVSYVTDGATYSAIAAPFIGILGSASHAISGVYSAAVSVGGGIYNGAVALGSGFASGLSNMLSGNFGGALNSIVGGIESALDDIGQALMDAFKQLVPVIIDLDHDGLSLISIADSRVTLDGDDGTLWHTGWVGPRDGILGYDENHDGIVNGYSEFGLARFAPGATTDLEGLRHFDSNGDGVLDAADAEFGKFLVWTDTNGDGVSQASETRSLADAGISSIALGSAGGAHVQDGNVVNGKIEVAFSDGDAGEAWDVTLASTHARGAEGFISEHAELTLMNGVYAFVTTDKHGGSLVVDASNLPATAQALTVYTGQGDDLVQVKSEVSVSLYDQEGDDRFAGPDSGAAFWLGAGNDEARGGTGGDSYIFSGAGFGHDRIEDAGGSDSIRFGADLSAFVVARHGQDLVIMSSDGASSVVIEDFYKGQSHAIETFEFGEVRFDYAALAADASWTTPAATMAAYEAPTSPGWVI